MDAMEDMCGGCNKVVRGTATLALERKFHPDCFKCVVCATPLTGEFYDIAGMPHCRKDYKRSQLPTCGICSKAVEGNQVHDREGNFYHDTCFVCDKCRGSLVEGYFTIGDKKLCPRCNVSNNVELAPVREELGHCASCYKRFAAGEAYSTVQGNKYHPGCIKCNFCKKVLSSGNYEWEQVTSIVLTFSCPSCISAGRADRCAACNKIIIANSNCSAFGKMFHTACFKCSKCSRLIKTAETYVKENDQPVCAQCAR